MQQKVQKENKKEQLFPMSQLDSFNLFKYRSN